MDESRDENTVATNAIDQPIPIDEELPDSIVTIFGDDAATSGGLEQRICCVFDLGDKRSCVAR